MSLKEIGRFILGFITKARTGLGCTVQVIGGILWVGCGILMFIWALYALFSIFGLWAIFLGFILLPITYAASIFIIWFSTGEFPWILLIPYISSWVGMILMGVGASIHGDE